jgi:hypothetical protein
LVAELERCTPASRMLECVLGGAFVCVAKGGVLWVGKGEQS